MVRTEVRTPYARDQVRTWHQLAKLHGIPETAIRNKEMGREKDLTEKVNQKVRADLVRTLVRTPYARGLCAYFAPSRGEDSIHCRCENEFALTKSLAEN